MQLVPLAQCRLSPKVSVLSYHIVMRSLVGKVHLVTLEHVH